LAPRPDHQEAEGKKKTPSASWWLSSCH